MSATPKPKVTVILANLGTPDEATAPAVRRFLKQFLSDTRVIEIPKFKKFSLFLIGTNIKKNLYYLYIKIKIF